MTQQENQLTVDELPDEYFEAVLYNTETGGFERLNRDQDNNEVLVLSLDKTEQWDEVPAAEFDEELYIVVPEEVVNDPVAYLTAVLENEEYPLGIVGNIKQDIAQSYAMEVTEIVESE